MKLRTRFAFTLVETLTGIVILTVASASSWVAVSTLFRGEQINTNNSTAINLLQKSQEEIRKASLTFYENLEKCQFPGPSFNSSNNAVCGLENLGANFNGFTRKADISKQSGSTEIKQAIITVNWTDKGQAKSMSSLVMVSRPPDPLPGNIIGTVRTSATGNALINGATITATLVGNTTTSQVTSTSALGSKGENYNMAVTTSGTIGAYKLPVGTWSITARANGYYDYPPSGNTATVVVTSNAESRFDFIMDPRPLDGVLNIRLIDGNTGALLPNFTSGRIYILDDGVSAGYRDNSTTFSKSISFNNTDPKTFTVATYMAYYSGFVGWTQSRGPIYCNYDFSYFGWSSSVMLDETSTNFACSNNWWGNQTQDRITVTSGNTTAVNVPLVPIPTATITGTVIDTAGNPLAGSVIYAKWPSFDGSDHWWIRNGGYVTATADKDGHYSIIVPATQSIFPNNNNFYGMTLRAEHQMPYNGCCDSGQQQLLYGYSSPVINLFPGSTITDINIKIGYPSNVDCGNVQGNIKDDSTGLALKGVSVTVQGAGNSTDPGGNYIYQCPSTGFKLPVGNARFYATLSNYYSYDSGGNRWYSSAPNVNIQKNSMADYNSKLWPVGTGTVIVTVLDAGSGLPINLATVRVSDYNGGQKTINTGSDGIATFNNVLETWPPSDLPADSFYNHSNQSGLGVSVTYSTGNYAASSTTIPLLRKNDSVNVTIKLAPPGGT